MSNPIQTGPRIDTVLLQQLPQDERPKTAEHKHGKYRGETVRTVNLSSLVDDAAEELTYVLEEDLEKEFARRVRFEQRLVDDLHLAEPSRGEASAQPDSDPPYRSGTGHHHEPGER